MDRRFNPRETGARPKVYNLASSQPGTMSSAMRVPISEISFSFCHLPYPAATIMDDSLVVMRTSLERGKIIVYLREELKPGLKLCVKVEALEDGPNNGLSFGVTTCPPPRQRQIRCHIQDFCKPTAECGGNSVWMKVFNINKIGDLITFEKIVGDPPGLVSITVNHRQPVRMLDTSGIFATTELYPFFMLTGTVSKMRLVSAPTPPSVPNPMNRPRNFRQTSNLIQHRAVGLQSSSATFQPRLPTYLKKPGPPSRARHNPRNLITETHISLDSWLLQPNIIVSNTVISRDGQGIKNYIFNRDPFLKEQIITFAVREIETFYPGTLTFGVTTEDPATLQLDTLPVNSNELQIERFNKTWYVMSDIVPSVAVNQHLSIKRGSTTFTVKTGSNNIQTLFYVDPNKTVYPFFNFNGSIKKIELVGNDVAIFNEALSSLESSLAQTSIGDARIGTCVICLDQPANHMLDPCYHVCVCGICSDHLKSTDRSCPICRASFTKVVKVFIS